MELLEMLESLRAEEASISRLFGGEGQQARRNVQAATYLNRLAEAAQLVGDVMTGRRPMYHLQEAMSTSDFPLLFGDILDRQLLANYRDYPATYTSYVRRSTVADFRTVKRYAVHGAETVLDDVKEWTEYPEAKLTEAPYSYQVKKYGRRIPFSWESLVNNDLDGLSSAPARMARAGRRSELKFVTGLFVGTTGPNTTFFASGNANVVTGNPALSISALQTAMQTFAAQKDTESEPIYVEGMTLVVPPALEITARNILNAVQLELTEVGGSSAQKLIAQNWMRNRVTLEVNPYIPVIATTNGNTSWFLFANPTSDRPAIEIGFLRGHEEPQIFMKVPNQRRVAGGGGEIREDFETDTIQYKVRHVFGGTLLDPKMAVASNGSGS